ncbi:hypothetical protein [Polaribacter sp.]|uniref:hypothetical protein n=1 Tax=Polaribacter sp. TaxID=1920175 RepID=UPI003F6D4A56
MKKHILLFASVFVFYSCLNDDNDRPNLEFSFVAIDEYIAPVSFVFGQKDTIKLKYSLKNNCSYFDNIYYEYQDTTRIVAFRAITDLDATCADDATQYDYNLIVTATQQEDYLFKFYKGEDANGDAVFEEVVVPVN